MKNITDYFRQVYVPVKALLLYQSLAEERATYLESYDCDPYGKLINAHPLNVKEVQQLSELLTYSPDAQKRHLRPAGLLPAELLYLNTQNDCAIWHTAAGERDLYFVESLNVPNGKAQVPPLLWKATSDGLSLFAIKSDERPQQSTPLYHAPFFNMYENGRVCMGTVNVDVSDCANLTDFMFRWQQYYFNSYFSHAISGHRSCKIPLQALWSAQIQTRKPFAIDQLIATRQTLKDILP